MEHNAPKSSQTKTIVKSTKIHSVTRVISLQLFALWAGFLGIDNQSTALLCVISRLSVFVSAEIRLASNELVMHNAFRLFRLPARSKIISQNVSSASANAETQYHQRDRAAKCDISQSMLLKVAHLSVTKFFTLHKIELCVQFKKFIRSMPTRCHSPEQRLSPKCIWHLGICCFESMLHVLSTKKLTTTHHTRCHFETT